MDMTRLNAWLDPLRRRKLRVKCTWRRWVGKEVSFAKLCPLVSDRIRHLPVLCISLPSDQAKRRFMARQAQRLGLKNFRFFDAIDGRVSSIRDFSAKGLYDDSLAVGYEGVSLSPPTVALTLSHFAVWEEIMREGHSLAMVLEDDAVFRGNLLDSVNVDMLPAGWDVCLLESWLRQKPPKENVEGNIFTLASYKGGSGGYLISSCGAEKLHHMSSPVFHPADGYFTWYNRHRCEKRSPWELLPLLSVFLVYPQPVINGSGAGYWKSGLGTGVIPY